MKVEILLNGTIKIVLMPENDIEKSILKQLGQTEIEAKTLEQATHILDKKISDGLVIGSKRNSDYQNSITIINQD